jgi:hypothetical protein
MPSFNGYGFIFSIEHDVFKRAPAALDKANKLMEPEGLTQGSVAQWQAMGSAAIDIRVECRCGEFRGIQQFTIKAIMSIAIGPTTSEKSTTINVTLMPFKRRSLFKFSTPDSKFKLGLSVSARVTMIGFVISSRVKSGYRPCLNHDKPDGQ